MQHLYLVCVVPRYHYYSERNKMAAKMTDFNKFHRLSVRKDPQCGIQTCFQSICRQNNVCSICIWFVWYLDTITTAKETKWPPKLPISQCFLTMVQVNTSVLAIGLREKGWRWMAERQVVSERVPEGGHFCFCFWFLFLFFSFLFFFLRLFSFAYFD